MCIIFVSNCVQIVCLSNCAIFPRLTVTLDGSLLKTFRVSKSRYMLTQPKILCKVPSEIDR